jgi:hypothetical protein
VSRSGALLASPRRQPGDPPDFRLVPGPRRHVPRGTHSQRHPPRRRRIPPARSLRRRSPRAAAPPNRVVGYASPATQWRIAATQVHRRHRGFLWTRRHRHPLRRHRRCHGQVVRPTWGPPSGRSRLARHRRARVRPRASPNPGMSGRPGRRSRGSTPPDGRRPVALAVTRRSIDGDGRGSSNGHRDRHRTPRTDKPGHRPCWAALAPSSGR